jgi:hypothetical protein
LLLCQGRRAVKATGGLGECESSEVMERSARPSVALLAVGERELGLELWFSSRSRWFSSRNDWRRWRSDASLARCRAGTLSVRTGPQSRSASIYCRSPGWVQSHWRFRRPERTLTNQLLIALARPNATFVAGFKG